MLISNTLRQLQEIRYRIYTRIIIGWLKLLNPGRINMNPECFRPPFFVEVGPKGELFIDDNTFINFGCVIIAHEKVSLGTHCLLGPNVQIFDFDHKHEILSKPYHWQGIETDPVTIGNNVWIGGNTIICKGVTIGDNSVIAAGSIVRSNIPSNCFFYNRKIDICKPLEYV